MNREQGYTLIEIMVAATLMAILSAVGLYSWRSWQQQQRLWQTGWQVRDFLVFLRDDANVYNRDHRLAAHRDAGGWCLVADAASAAGCPAGDPFTLRPPWPEVSLLAITPALGFYGLRNTAWAGRIALQSAAGGLAIVVSGWGRIRLCRATGEGQC